MEQNLRPKTQHSTNNSGFRNWSDHFSVSRTCYKFDLHPKKNMTADRSKEDRKTMILSNMIFNFMEVIFYSSLGFYAQYERVLIVLIIKS